MQGEIKAEQFKHQLEVRVEVGLVFCARLGHSTVPPHSLPSSACGDCPVGTNITLLVRTYAKGLLACFLSSVISVHTGFCRLAFWCPILWLGDQALNFRWQFLGSLRARSALLTSLYFNLPRQCCEGDVATCLSTARPERVREVSTADIFENRTVRTNPCCRQE